MRHLAEAGLIRIDHHPRALSLQALTRKRSLPATERLVESYWPGREHRRSRIVKAVQASPGLSPSEISRLTGIPDVTVRRDINHLQNGHELKVWRRGKLRFVGLPGKPRPLRLSPSLQATLRLVKHQPRTQAQLVRLNERQGIGRSATQRGLKRLEVLGLVEAEVRGRTKYYRIP